MKRAPRSRQRHDLYAKYHDYDSEISDLLGECGFNTHDLATFAGWRSAGDLNLKRSLGLDPGESDDARHHAWRMLADVLRHNAIERDDFFAVLAFLARTRSRLLAISLEDLLGVADQPNIPGTVNEHPNWRRRLDVDVSRLAEAFDVAALKNAVSERRGGHMA